MQVNAELAKMERDRKPQPKSYCPGCGEESSWTPDLCPECLGKLSEKEALGTERARWKSE